eukprot:3509705-Rhodomonas_salina.2
MIMHVRGAWRGSRVPNRGEGEVCVAELDGACLSAIGELARERDLVEELAVAVEPGGAVDHHQHLVRQARYSPAVDRHLLLPC